MPNWCDNHLRITGPPEERGRFVREARGTLRRYGSNKDSADAPVTEMLCFHKLYPVPEELLQRSYGARKENERGLQSVDGCRSGYGWEIGHWGCKWGVSDCNCRMTPPSPGDNETEYWFQTPWTPPIGFFEHISAMFPKLQFELTYSEPDWGFEGRFAVCNGGVELDGFQELLQKDML
jgi:hypothetical protein